VSTQGRAAAVAVHSLPELDKSAEAVSIHKVSPLPEGDSLAAIFSLPAHRPDQAESYVMTVTKEGLVKKTSAGDLPGPSSEPFILVKVNEGDELGWVRLTDGKSEIIMVTTCGMSIRFKEDEVRPMGLVAAGVGGIKLGAGDEIIGVEPVSSHGELFLLAADGRAKRVKPDDFPLQGRYGQGVITWKLARGLRLVGVMAGKAAQRATIHFEKAASKQIRLDEAASGSRTSTGQMLVEIKTGDRILGITILQMTVAGESLEEKKEPKKIVKPRKPKAQVGKEKDV
jgi:DNA gyrase subunit A